MKFILVFVALFCFANCQWKFSMYYICILYRDIFYSNVMYIDEKSEEISPDKDFETRLDTKEDVYIDEKSDNDFETRLDTKDKVPINAKEEDKRK